MSSHVGAAKLHPLLTSVNISHPFRSTSKLEFSSVVFDDEGQYKCQATYSGLAGNLQSTQFELFVRGENCLLDLEVSAAFS